MNFRTLVKEKKEEIKKEEKEEVLKDSEEDFLDFFDDEDEISEKFIPSIDDLRKLFGAWCLEIRAKVPDTNPAAGFQIYWGEHYDKPTEIAEADLNAAFHLVAEGRMPMTEFKRRFIEVIMTRTTYYMNGVPQRGYESKYQAFRQRLSQFIQIPEGWIND